MPEGDSLRRLARRITNTLATSTVERTIVRDPRLGGVDLSGTVLVSADAVGKHLIVKFSDERGLHAHLGMQGAFSVGRRSREPEWKQRLVLTTTCGPLVAEDVPEISVRPVDEIRDDLMYLGPDLCAIDPPDASAIVERLVALGEVPLTAALLDQRAVAGFGNVFGNDLPFIAGVSPHTPVADVADLDVLVRVGIALIRWSADHDVRNMIGKRLHRPSSFVHGAGRSRCPHCGDRLRYQPGDTTSWQRSITWCASCQPPGSGVDRSRVRRLLGLHPAMRGVDV